MHFNCIYCGYFSWTYVVFTKCMVFRHFENFAYFTDWIAKMKILQKRIVGNRIKSQFICQRNTEFWSTLLVDSAISDFYDFLQNILQRLNIAFHLTLWLISFQLLIQWGKIYQSWSRHGDLNKKWLLFTLFTMHKYWQHLIPVTHIRLFKFYD